MGYVLLGIAALGHVSLNGAALQMFTHGMITGLLFVMVGIIYDRAHTRDIDQLSGLAHTMPLAATVMIIAGLASLGLPAMSGLRRRDARLPRQLRQVHRADDHRRVRHPALGRLHHVDGPARLLRAEERALGDRCPTRTAGGSACRWPRWSSSSSRVGVYPALVVDVLDTGIINIVKVLG